VDNRQASQVTTGAIIIVVGLLLLAGQLDSGWHFGRLWPLILVALGMGKYLSTNADGRRGDGFWLVALGGIFLLHTFRIFTLNHSWPLFVVLGGLQIIFNRENREPKRRGDDKGTIQS